jgi:hypothetical protein
MRCTWQVHHKLILAPGTGQKYQRTHRFCRIEMRIRGNSGAIPDLWNGYLVCSRPKVGIIYARKPGTLG